MGMRFTRQRQRYVTTFQTTENPLSDGGRWVNGAADALNWNNVRATSTLGAYGTQSTVNGATGPPYNDSVSQLLPATGVGWSANQEVQGKVFLRNRNTFTGFHEVELTLRGAYTSNTWKMYECLFSVGPTDYVEIVRWIGPLGTQSPVTNNTNAFISLALNNLASGPTIADGDEIRARIEGSTITAYHRPSSGGAWTAYASAVDTNYTSGNPGCGHWVHGVCNDDDYGLSSWQVVTW